MSKTTGNRIQWEGLDELRAVLRKLPEALVGEATGIVHAHASAAYHEIDAAYAKHERSGILRAWLTLTPYAVSRYGTGELLKNRAKHAWLFENGSQARHGAGGNERGVGSRAGNRLAFRGSMPAHPTFIPAVVRQRRRMYNALAAMLRRVGFEVTGAAA